MELTHISLRLTALSLLVVLVLCGKSVSLQAQTTDRLLSFEPSEKQKAKPTDRFQSQDTANQGVARFPQFWLSGSHLGTKNMIGYSISSSYARENKTILSARFITMEERSPVFGGEGFPFDPYKEFQEVALLYGLMADGKFGQASLSAGLGWSFHSHRPATPGLALEARASATIPIMGFGIKGFAHLSNKSYTGIGFFLELGKLSTK